MRVIISVQMMILKMLEDNNLIAVSYCNEKGEVNEKSNPNGALQNIAGIFNKEKNILLQPYITQF